MATILPNWPRVQSRPHLILGVLGQTEVVTALGFREIEFTQTKTGADDCGAGVLVVWAGAGRANVGSWLVVSGSLGHSLSETPAKLMFTLSGVVDTLTSAWSSCGYTVTRTPFESSISKSWMRRRFC